MKIAILLLTALAFFLGCTETTSTAPVVEQTPVAKDTMGTPVAKVDPAKKFLEDILKFSNASAVAPVYIKPKPALSKLSNADSLQRHNQMKEIIKKAKHIQYYNPVYADWQITDVYKKGWNVYTIGDSQKDTINNRINLNGIDVFDTRNPAYYPDSLGWFVNADSMILIADSTIAGDNSAVRLACMSQELRDTLTSKIKSKWEERDLEGMFEVVEKEFVFYPEDPSICTHDDVDRKTPH